MSGKLYLVATPIGNLKDITLRAIETLQNVDIIACEDTRHTVKLLNHLQIKKKLVSYFEHSTIEKGEYLVSLMKDGQNIALVSDAGTPAISDPGEELVKLAICNDIEIVPIPGPAALISGIIASGFFTGRFVFEGFLPTNKRSKKDRINELKYEKRTIILYEAPHKLTTTLKDLYGVLGNRKIVLARELTKIHEEFFRTDIVGAMEKYKEASPRGEFVLLIDSNNLDETKEFELQQECAYTQSQNLLNMTVTKHIEYYILTGMDWKLAIKQVAKDRGVGKREIYMHYVK